MPGYTVPLNHLCNTHSNKWSPSVKQFNLVSPGDLTDVVSTVFTKILQGKDNFQTTPLSFAHY